MRKTKKTGLIATAVFAIAGAIELGAVSVYAAIRNMRPPWFVLAYMVLPKNLSWRLFPTRATHAGAALPLPVVRAKTGVVRARTQVPFAGGKVQMREYLRRTRTKSLVIVHGGKIVGRFGATTTRYTSWSMAKSITSLAVGVLITEGKIKYTDTVSQLLPTYRGLGNFDSITVADLLDMSSGIKMGEHYGIRQRYVGVQGMYMVRSQLEYIRRHTDTFAAPGAQAMYRSVDAQLLGLMATAASGETLAHVVERAIWRPAGAQRDMLWGLDHPGGSEQAFASANATAEDYARVGLWLLTEPRVLGSHLSRIHEARDIQPLNPGWRYSSQWWHPPGATDLEPDVAIGRGDFTACGWRGQYLWIDPRTQTVIAKFSNDPTPDGATDQIEVFRSIADRL